jgi:hypothetical protein
MPADRAKGHAIWLAKVVASRRGAPSPSATSHDKDKQGDREHEAPEPKFRSLGGQEQTDRTFDHDIVERMGREFYDAVFRPAIGDAYARGEQYVDIRDSIRKSWK